ncbi:hypothetical protein BX666DRAFT_1874283 [Dichotomocladium elegans]|nr:hypothetical protein BX666DRAFT_1874283 [Dichotomocladium elegans]
MSDSFTPVTPSDKENYTFVLPGITPETLRLSGRLLEKNHKEHHLFFNDRGFHNHLIHHLLSAYAMGASPERLQAIYDDHASYQRPLPASIKPLTRENYKSELGNREAVTSFQDMFRKEVSQHGIIPTIRRWVFSGDMLARTIGGAFHPIIHLGYAVEFELAGLAVEGLAMAACTSSDMAKFVPEGPAVERQQVFSTAREAVSQLASDVASRLGLRRSDTSEKSAADATDLSLEDAIKTNAILAVTEAIRKDSDLDGIVKYQDQRKYDSVFKSEKAMAIIKAYHAKWEVPETEQGVKEKLKELYTAAMLIYGASAIRKEGIELDFFLVHALTSVRALAVILPHLSLSEAASLLKAHAAATLFYYVNRGRPSLQIDLLLEFESPEIDNDSNNLWLGTCDRAIAAPEVHLIKAVHAIAQGQVVYGHDGPFAKAWRHAADLTNYRVKFGKKNGSYWCHEGVGFDESWK